MRNWHVDAVSFHWFSMWLIIWLQKLFVNPPTIKKRQKMAVVRFVYGMCVWVYSVLYTFPLYYHHRPLISTLEKQSINSNNFNDFNDFTWMNFHRIADVSACVRLENAKWCANNSTTHTFTHSMCVWMYWLVSFIPLLIMEQWAIKYINWT